MDYPEALNRSVHFIFSAKPEEKPADSGSDDSPATKVKLRTINSRAHHIAYNVRLKTGEQQPQQGYVTLKDGRTAFLKRSQNESNQNDVLEIHIGFSSDFQYFTHVEYDLMGHCVKTFEVLRMDHSPVIVYDTSNSERQDPAGLMCCEIADRVDHALGMVETASEHIEERMPASTLSSLRIK